jgi:hypothetical protein
MLLGGAGLFLSAVVLSALPRPAASVPAGQSQEPVPAYHTQLPPGPLPATMAPSNFENPVIKNAYHLAAKVKKALYQQPCYCHCDRSLGHGSLLDCFVGRHASECDVCLKEGIYTYEQTRKGRTPAEIRAGIERGEWRSVDLEKYNHYPQKP